MVWMVWMAEVIMTVYTVVMRTLFVSGSKHLNITRMCITSEHTMVSLGRKAVNIAHTRTHARTCAREGGAIHQHPACLGSTAHAHLPLVS